MAGSTFQPPIHLDPNQDPSQQIAFINQNFQSLASVLETNSFRIVDENTVTIPSISVTSGAGTYATNSSSVTVTHNLGFAPTVIASIVSNGSPVQYTQIPFTNFVGVGATAFWVSTFSYADATKVIFTQQVMTINTTQNQAATNLKYYFLQLVAS